MSCTII